MFCHSSLGANEAIENFPVGRRLAFDAAKGRLWVVCNSCDRWNLTPLDERWEAVEQCERKFRDTKLRVSTDNIGLAKLREGTTLIRIGNPLRPEMAAWRYGDQFKARRRKYLTIVAGSTVLIGGVVLAGPVFGLLGGVGGVFIPQLPNIYRGLARKRTIVKVPMNGRILRLTAQHVDQVSLRRTHDGGYWMTFDHHVGIASYFAPDDDEDRIELDGADALRMARILLPRINRAGAKSDDVARAVTRLETSDGPEQLFAASAIAPAPLIRTNNRGRSRWSNKPEYDDSGYISSLPPSIRLAMEMSLHEEDERRALEGELALLEDRWREAEEIASISDDMFLPSGVGAMLQRLKGKSE